MFITNVEVECWVDCSGVLDNVTSYHHLLCCCLNNNNNNNKEDGTGYDQIVGTSDDSNTDIMMMERVRQHE